MTESKGQAVRLDPDPDPDPDHDTAPSTAVLRKDGVCSRS